MIEEDKEECKEEWKIVYFDGVEVNYEVSSTGNVRNATTFRCLKLRSTPHGYLRAFLSINNKIKTKVIHRIVAEAFIPNLSELPSVNHKNYILSDNRVENLEWISVSDNIKHSYKKEGRKPLKRNPESVAEGKPIPGYEGYLATEDGRIYSTKTGIFLKFNASRGYYAVSVRVDGKETKPYVHQLVAKTYIPNPENKLQVNHIDGDKFNNNISNLEWLTQSENICHSVTMKLKPTKGGVDQLSKDGKILNTFQSLNEAARCTGVAKGSISNCCLGKLKTAGGFVWCYKNQKKIS